MRTLPLASRQVPIVGLGTWNMEDDADASIAALRRGLDLGMTHIDTAEMYGAGEVERIVGRAIAGRRDDVFLVSKIMPDGASRAGTVRTCEASLQRLGTDHLDLYLLHWPGKIPFAETLAGFDDLVRAGKIRAFGVSNFDLDELEAAAKLAPGRIACNQVLHHLRERHVEAQLLDACARHGVALVSYSPYGQGNFPDAYDSQGEVLADIAKEVGATTRQVALAFLLSRRKPGAPVFVIPKTSRLAHVEENAGAAALELSASVCARLEATFPIRPGRELPTI